VRVDGDEMPADADDGDAGHLSRTYMAADSRLELHSASRRSVMYLETPLGPLSRP
jgi:hypothetical protein